MKKILTLFFLFVPLAFTVSCSSSNYEYIVSVHDGDTFTTESGNIIRLFGVDTPEVSDKNNGFETTTGIQQIYALQAKAFTESLILNHEVRQEAITEDNYGRQVSKIFIGSYDLAFELVGHGLAVVMYFDVQNEKSPFYSTDYSYYQTLTNIQHRAYDEEVGIWANKEQFKQIFPNY